LRGGPVGAAEGVLGACGAAGVLALTWKYGPGIGPDSIHYLAAAESLLAGDGYRGWDGSPYLLWPPLFPTLLALGSLSGLPLPEAARLLNALAFGLTVALTGVWLREWVRRPRLVLPGTGLVLLSPVLVRVSTMAWTEATFTLFTLAALWGLHRGVRHGDRRGTWLAVGCAAGCAAAAALTRYVGVTVIGTGAAVLFLLGRGSPARRAGSALGFAALSAAPLALWLARNHRVSATLTGGRTWAAVTGVRPPLFISPAVAALSLCVALFLALAAAACIARRRAGGETDALAVLTLFCVAYFGGILALARQGASNPVDYRLLTPLYVPLVLLAVGLAAHVLERGADARPVWLGFGLFALAAVGVLVRESAAMPREGAGGYATDRWVRSDLLRWLRENPLPGRVYSNAPEALHFHLGLEAGPSPPKYVGFSRVVDRESLRAFRAKVAAGGEPAFLVWFEDAPYGGHLVPVEELAAALRLVPVAAGSHGTVYRIAAGAVP
jgi:4-amino-4-deoxy-L-arabinose transferase-like glycosyltransferase